MKKKPFVLLESPFRGNRRRMSIGNMIDSLIYAYACIQDSLRRGELPIASHVLFGPATDDNNPVQRREGISAGNELANKVGVSKVVVYTDNQCSTGMIENYAKKRKEGMSIKYRKLGKRWKEKFLQSLSY